MRAMREAGGEILDEIGGCIFNAWRYNVASPQGELSWQDAKPVFDHRLIFNLDDEL